MQRWNCPYRAYAPAFAASRQLMRSTTDPVSNVFRGERLGSTYGTNNISRTRVHDERNDETVQTQHFGENEDEDLSAKAVSTAPTQCAIMHPPHKE